MVGLHRFGQGVGLGVGLGPRTARPRDRSDPREREISCEGGPPQTPACAGAATPDRPVIPANAGIPQFPFDAPCRNPPSTAPRVAGALENLLAGLDEWRKDIEVEARRAARRHDRLVTAIRATVDTLDPPEREPWLARLRALSGVADPNRPKRRPTTRTRLALKWQREREPATFPVAELLAHFDPKGLPTGRHYLPTLLFRYAAEGLVTRSTATTRIWRSRAISERTESAAAPPCTRARLVSH